MKMFSLWKISSIVVLRNVSAGNLLKNFSASLLHLLDYPPWICRRQRLREQPVICHASGYFLRRPASVLLLPSRLAPCHLPQRGRLWFYAQSKLVSLREPRSRSDFFALTHNPTCLSGRAEKPVQTFFPLTRSPTCLSERAEKPERFFCSYAQSNLSLPLGEMSRSDREGWLLL